MTFESKYTPIELYAIKTVPTKFQAIFRFSNGYGASLIRNNGSYGNEIAVVKFYGPGSWDWGVCYDTPVSDDVLPSLTYPGIEDTLDKIKALPPCQT